MAGFFQSIGRGFRDFLGGSPEKRENLSLLRPEQEGLFQNLTQAGMNPGAGGAFGNAADYYRNLLGDNSADYNAFAAPAMRQYYENIVPNISEQFAGMGSGGLSSSGFRNAQTQGGVDLAERLGALRANLRQAGASGLANIGQLGLGNYSQNMVTQQGTPGFLSQAAPAIGTGLGFAFGGPAGAGIGNWLGNQFGGSSVGKNSSPYGQNQPQASPTYQDTGSGFSRGY